MDRRALSRKAIHVYDVIPYYLGLAMGALLVVMGAVGVYNSMTEETKSVIVILSWILMLSCGTAILTLFRNNLVVTIGLYAVSLGLTRVAWRLTAMDMGSTISILINIIPLILAINLVYTGSSFTLGRVIRRTFMIATAVILAIVDLVMLLAPGFIPQSRDPTSITLECIMYFLLIIILDSEQIRYGTSIGTHVRHLDRIRMSHIIDKGSFITPEVANNLMFRTGYLWRYVGDPVVEKEMMFVIVGDNSDAFVTAQLWWGNSPMYLTIQSEPGSTVRANRLAIDTVIREDNMLHFYGRNGADFVLEVKEGI